MQKISLLMLKDLSPGRLPIPPPQHVSEIIIYENQLQKFDDGGSSVLPLVTICLCYDLRVHVPHMDQIVPIIWVVVGVALMIAEIFTLGFVLFWFGIGAIVAALAGFLGAGVGLQFLLFAVVSIALTAMSRTILAKYLPTQGEHLRTAVDSLPGKVGTVTTPSTGALNEGAVKVYGSVWTAYPIDDVALTQGEKVEVVEVKGSSIYVRRVRDELPEWRSN